MAPRDSHTAAATVAPDSWQKLESKRILFAHQSVGRDIIGGLGALRAGAPAPLRLHDLAAGPAPDGAVLMHVNVGQNGEPLTKLRHFREVLEGGLGRDVDVAMLKFCFWDVRRDTDVDAVFAEYQSTFAALEKAFPSVQFIHATVPLMTADRDWRAGLRRLLGRPVPTTQDNAARHRLSDLIRQHYGAKHPIFDLEAAEAADDDEDVPSLAADLSTDGGHLNDAGQRRLAAAFVTAVSAAIPPAADRQ